jgi:hypothetical protein
LICVSFTHCFGVFVKTRNRTPRNWSLAAYLWVNLCFNGTGKI